MRGHRGLLHLHGSVPRGIENIYTVVTRQIPFEMGDLIQRVGCPAAVENT